MGKLNIFEPHPTVAQNTYTYSGRGGAGNAFRAPATTPPSGVAYPSTKPKSSTRFYSGRGGAGNAQPATQTPPTFSFDEEFSRAESRDKSAAAAYTGRGGAGNIYTSKPRKESDASSRRDSSSTTGSLRAGFWGRLSGTSMASR